MSKSLLLMKALAVMKFTPGIYMKILIIGGIKWQFEIRNQEQWNLTVEHTHTHTTCQPPVSILAIDDWLICLCVFRKQTTARRGRKLTVSTSMPCDAREFHRGVEGRGFHSPPCFYFLPCLLLLLPFLNTSSLRLNLRARELVLICPKMFLFDILQPSCHNWNIYAWFAVTHSAVGSTRAQTSWAVETLRGFFFLGDHWNVLNRDFFVIFY